MDEEWRPVAEFEGYDVSSWGRIRSHKTGRPKFRRQARAADDSLQITFCEHGKNHTRLSHLVVAAAFLGEKPEGHRLAHLDGDRINNEVSNLRYESL
jgi:HNH endonuclease/NUMOD4 motif